MEKCVFESDNGPKELRWHPSSPQVLEVEGAGEIELDTFRSTIKERKSIGADGNVSVNKNKVSVVLCESSRTVAMVGDLGDVEQFLSSIKDD